MASPDERAPGPAHARRHAGGPSPRVRRNRNLAVARAVAVVVVAGVGLVSCTGTKSPSSSAVKTPTTTTTTLFPQTGTGVAHLQPGSDPSVLPRPVLFADEGNDRLLIVDPHGRTPWSLPQ